MTRFLSIALFSLFATACLDEAPQDDTRDAIPEDHLDDIDLDDPAADEPTTPRGPHDDRPEINEEIDPGDCVPLTRTDSKLAPQKLADDDGC